MSTGIKYDIYETEEYFQKETENIKNHLVKRVESGKMDPLKAREKLDMYRSMLIYLKVCVSWAEKDKFLDDQSFSALALYSLEEEQSKGHNKLKKAMKNL